MLRSVGLCLRSCQVSAVLCARLAACPEPDVCRDGMETSAKMAQMCQCVSCGVMVQDDDFSAMNELHLTL